MKGDFDWNMVEEIMSASIGELVSSDPNEDPYMAWIALGHTLGWVNSHIILGLVFIFVLQPIAYIMRITGYDPLRRRRKGEITYREDCQDHRIDLTRIF